MPGQRAPVAASSADWREYARESERLPSKLRVASRSRPREIGDGRADLDGYALFDLNFRLQNFHPRIEAAGAVHNLFGTRYSDPALAAGLPGDYPRPGPTVFVKVKYRF